MSEGLLGLLRGAVEAVTDLADLVWPRRCAGCGYPGVALCPPCLASLRTSGPGPPVPVLARETGPALPVWGAAGYEGLPVTILLAWKERGRHDLTRPLAAALAAPVAAAVAAGGAVLVPVPASAAARRRRGADLVADLGRALGRSSAGVPGGSVPPVVPALRLVRRVRDQAGLTAAGRRENLSGAMGPTRRAARLRGRPVILLDDVVTTGATLAEARRVLLSKGSPVVGACCLCVTSRGRGVSASGA